MTTVWLTIKVHHILKLFSFLPPQFVYQNQHFCEAPTNMIWNWYYRASEQKVSQGFSSAKTTCLFLLRISTFRDCPLCFLDLVSSYRAVTTTTLPSQFSCIWTNINYLNWPQHIKWQSQIFLPLAVVSHCIIKTNPLTENVTMWNDNVPMKNDWIQTE